MRVRDPFGGSFLERHASGVVSKLEMCEEESSPSSGEEAGVGVVPSARPASSSDRDLVWLEALYVHVVRVLTLAQARAPRGSPAVAGRRLVLAGQR